MYAILWLTQKTSPGKQVLCLLPRRGFLLGAAVLAGVAQPSTAAVAGEAANRGAITGATQTLTLLTHSTW